VRGGRAYKTRDLWMRGDMDTGTQARHYAAFWERSILPKLSPHRAHRIAIAKWGTVAHSEQPKTPRRCNKAPLSHDMSHNHHSPHIRTHNLTTAPATPHHAPPKPFLAPLVARSWTQTILATSMGGISPLLLPMDCAARSPVPESRAASHSTRKRVCTERRGVATRRWRARRVPMVSRTRSTAAG